MSTSLRYVKGYCLVTGASHGIGKAISYVDNEIITRKL